MRRRTTLTLVALIVATSFAVSPSALGQDTATTEAPDLDLREANVVGVEFDREEGDARTYVFSVTLYHDDDGEPGYANWWQVETLNGTELGRRDLLHAHGTEPFTRSESIEVPANVSLVVVRGHDQTHGYGGQAMVVDLRTGASEAIRQRSDARNFSKCEVVEDESVATGTTAATATTENATGTPTTQTDLLACPWEETTTDVTTGEETTTSATTG